MTDLEKSEIIAACEKNAVPENEIDFSEIPEITDFSGRQRLLDESPQHLCRFVEV